ncbi:MAG: hypothetical protein KF822_03715 [Steroidobacteraceae bacterium]|nr:hypothetical protein [Steroidobacteraceae bacterium]
MTFRAGVLACALLAALPAAATDTGHEETAAAWQRQEVDFVYMGFTTRYSCGGLKSKVKLLLKHLGARPDIKITERGCEFGYQYVADFPRLKVAFYVPGVPEEGQRDVGEPVLGMWKPVVIKRNSPRGLEMGDCELVELFRDRFLPKFRIRSMQGDVNCIPHQLVGNRIDLRFEVLTAVQDVAAAAQAQRQ